MLKRFLSVFHARNKEFYRDRAGLGWNFIFPFCIMLGFAAMFERGGHTQYKLGVIFPESRETAVVQIPESIKNRDVFKILKFDDRELGFHKLRHHKIDLLFESGHNPVRYWIGDNSPKGEIAESLFLKTLYDPETLAEISVRAAVRGEQITYIDWLFPGILAMNMMFSALFGVGYIIVRYRKNGVLKRLKATPLKPLEYLSAQIASRMFVLLFSGTVLFVGCTAIFKFPCKGSHFDLALVFSLGGASIISLGLIIASRSGNEEVANGLLNMISWPMMFLSEVWFSIEGSPEWVRKFAEFLPLTHVTKSMRLIMHEGAGLSDLGYSIVSLSVMTVIFIAIGSALFKWTPE